jgi:hypothetical protein
MTITALIPVLSRPKNVRPLIESFLANSVQTTKLLFIVQADDTAELAELAEHCKWGRLDNDRVWYTIEPKYVVRWSAKLNAGFRYDNDSFALNEKCETPADWYLLGADDLRFHKGWDDNPTLTALMARPEIGVIGTNDLGNPAVIAGKHATHPLMRRTYIEEQGIEEGLSMIAPECYHHNYVDNEIVGLAFKRKAYAHCHESIVEHLHPVWAKAEMDETYKLGVSRYRQDEQLFKVREMLYGFPKFEER